MGNINETRGVDSGGKASPGLGNDAKQTISDLNEKLTVFQAARRNPAGAPDFKAFEKTCATAFQKIEQLVGQLKKDQSDPTGSAMQILALNQVKLAAENELKSMTVKGMTAEEAAAYLKNHAENPMIKQMLSNPVEPKSSYSPKAIDLSSFIPKDKR